MGPPRIGGTRARLPIAWLYVIRGCAIREAEAALPRLVSRFDRIEHARRLATDWARCPKAAHITTQVYSSLFRRLCVCGGGGESFFTPAKTKKANISKEAVEMDPRLARHTTRKISRQTSARRGTFNAPSTQGRTPSRSASRPPPRGGRTERARPSKAGRLPRAAGPSGARSQPQLQPQRACPCPGDPRGKRPWPE